MSSTCFPSEQEQHLIANDIFITKVRTKDQSIKPGYHKWKDIWSDKKLFQINGQNPMIKMRAIAVTLPMLLSDELDGESCSYEGYVADLSHSVDRDGKVRIFPLNEINWV